MKKVISILLSAVLLISCQFSFGTPAFAATSINTPDELLLDSTVDVTITFDKSDDYGFTHGWAKFTPETDGTYMLTLYNLYGEAYDYSAYPSLFDSLKNAQSYNNEMDFEGLVPEDDGSSISFVYNLKAGVTYYADILLFSEFKEAVVPVKITKHTHKYISYVYPADLDYDGESGKVCDICYATTSVKLIPRISKATLSATSYTYDGKTKKPSVTVKDRKGTALKNGTDYTVTYPSGRKNVGKYTVKIKFKGKYEGSKSLSFTVKPKSTSISSIKAGSKRFTVKWKKQSTQVTGYQIQYSTSSKFKSPKTSTVTSYKTTSKTIKSLKAKKKYYVRIRTYKTVGKTKYYSSWSKAKSITTKK